MSDRHGLSVVGLLVLLSALLLGTAPAGTFSIDEASYIATIAGLRGPSFSVGASARLAPSRELYGFDAAPLHRPVRVPVASSSPPLFAPLALPFSRAGVRGLMALQTLAFAACAAMVFSFVRRRTGRVELAWVALVTFVVGSFALEYAAAIWPHALAMALIMAAVDLTSRVRDGGSPWLAAAAGACVALAAGLRYQDAALLAAVGAGLAWAPRATLRTAVLAFALGATPVVAASSGINRVRHGSWNPVSKGGSYLAITGRSRVRSGVVTQAVTSTWSRVVDYSTWPYASPGMRRDPRTGALMLNSQTKKALLQSSPWAVIPLLAMLLAVRRRARAEGADALLRRELLALGIIVAGVIGTFAVYGYRRYDGWCFNQRYLLEAMPLCAIGLALALSRARVSMGRLAFGTAAGLIIAFAVLSGDVGAAWRGHALLRLPLVLSLVLGVVWLLSKRLPVAVLSSVLGLSLGWAAGVQVGDDFVGARSFRSENAAVLAAVDAALPRVPAVLFAYWSSRDALGPLLLDRDVLVVDPWIDGGSTARAVVDSALDTGRRVFVLMPIPSEILGPMALQLRRSRTEHPLMFELRR